ncbi:MAG: TonB-dependent receptor [Candidatus Rokubacteria bacterium]|nr:TonB-dependent receptor [Candidatus Rokubacteria bacterium]
MAALDPAPAPLLALPLSDAPGATFVITAEEIERSGAANIFELLRRVPGVDIRYTPMGGHIGIRSTGPSPFSEEVLLLIDGTPYNSPDKGGFPGHPNYTGFFPLDRIARIEIIRGPISVLHGANAFGGVINIVSKNAADAVLNKVEGSAYGVTITAGQRSLYDRSVRTALIRDGWEAALEASAQDGDTPIRVNGDADHSRDHVYGALRRGNFRLSVLHQRSRHGSFSFLGTPTQTARNNVDIVDTQYERRIGEFILRASLAMNRYRGTTCAECHNSLTKEPDSAKTADVGRELERDQRLRLALRADRTLTDRQDFTFGLEAARDSIDRRIVKLDGAPSDRALAGVYVQHQWHFGNRKLHVMSGLRRDWAEGLGDVVSPRLAFVAEPKDNVIVRASWSRAFRAPTWNERYIRQRFLPEEIAPGLILTFQGEPGLRRERVDATEAGFSWRLHPRLVGRLDLYHNRVHGFIVRSPAVFVAGTPNELRILYENRPEAFTVRGYELTLIGRPARSLSLTVGYAYRRHTLAEDDIAAAYAPKTRSLLSLAWSPRPRWAFDLTGTYTGNYTVSFPEVFGVRWQPSYVLVDAAVRYRLPWAKADWDIGLIGRNLGNDHPRETLVGPDIDTSLRGRALALELRGDF